MSCLKCCVLTRNRNKEDKTLEEPVWRCTVIVNTGTQITLYVSTEALVSFPVLGCTNHFTRNIGKIIREVLITKRKECSSENDLGNIFRVRQRGN